MKTQKRKIKVEAWEDPALEDWGDIAADWSPLEIDWSIETDWGDLLGDWSPIAEDWGEIDLSDWEIPATAWNAKSGRGVGGKNL